MTPVIPGNHPESLLHHLHTAEEHTRHRPTSSLTHLLLPYPAPHQLTALGLTSGHLVLSCCRASLRGRESAKATDQGAESKSTGPWPSVLSGCPHDCLPPDKTAQLSRAGAQHGTRKLPMNLHWQCQAQPLIIQEMLGNLRKQGHSLPGPCGQVSTGCSSLSWLARCR